MLTEEQRLARNARQRAWKKANKDSVNATNRKVKAKNPEKYREINRVSIAKKREEDPERFKAIDKRYRANNPEKVKKLLKDWISQRPGRYLFYNAKARAKKFGLPFDLTVTDVVIPEFCPVLGVPIEATVKGRRGFHPNSPSIDRVVPVKGYVRGNVCVISNRANWIKRDATAGELRLIADYIDRVTGG
jgi:hypothetical protein